MADVIDVQNALATIIESTVYPSGTSQPSISNSPIIIYSGWPSSAQLDADLAAGKCHVSIFPKQEERNTTRYPENAQVLSQTLPTLTTSVAGGTVTFGGTITANPQNIAVVVNHTPYVYAVQPTDTLASIAASIAALISVNIVGTTHSGASITIPNGSIQAARVGAVSTAYTEVRRQERVFMITVWTSSPTLRDQISAAIDVALAQTEFLTMPDGYAARLIYKGSPVTDALQKTTLYRRDLNYSVEYATTVSSSAPDVVTTTTNVTDNGLSTVTINL